MFQVRKCILLSGIDLWPCPFIEVQKPWLLLTTSKALATPTMLFLLSIYLADRVGTGECLLEVQETQMCEYFWGKQLKRVIQNDGRCRLSLNAGAKPISISSSLPLLVNTYPDSACVVKINSKLPYKRWSSSVVLFVLAIRFCCFGHFSFGLIAVTSEVCSSI